MAQHARPHWYTQREYLRDRLSSVVSGLGSLPLSTRPISRLDHDHRRTPLRQA